MNTADRTRDISLPSAGSQPWHVAPGTRVWVGGHNTDAKREVERHLDGVVRPPTGPIDAAFLAPKSVDEGLYFAGKLRHRLEPAGNIWFVYPKPTAAEQAGLIGSREDLIAGMSERGFAEVETALLSDSYHALCFRLNA